MNAHLAIDTARDFQRLGLQQFAFINSVAAAFSLNSPLLKGVFKANAATAELLAHEPDAPQFNIKVTDHHGILHRVEEQDTALSPHSTLKRFAKPTLEDHEQPKVLLLSPLSGHPPTLLKPTVEEFLHDHDTHIVDWKDPKDVPLAQGSFTLNHYIKDIIRSFEEIGPNAHVVAVCQPGVPLVAALSVMEAQGHPCLPLSATFKGSPIDTSVSPTAVNEPPQKLKQAFGGSQEAIDHYYSHMVHPISARHVGRGQPAHHGFTQLAGFYSLDPESHTKAYLKNWWDIALNRDPEAVARHEEFYRDYNHVMNLPGGYLMDTLDAAFLNQRLTDGTFVYTDPETGEVHNVDPANIQNTALFVVEGEGDTITGLGQTAALLEMATNLPADMKHYRRSPKGHYGLFAGSDFRDHTAAEIRGFIREIEAHHGVISATDTHKNVRSPQTFEIDAHPELRERHQPSL